MYIYFSISLIGVFASFFFGYRLGRNAGASERGRQDNTSTAMAVGESAAELKRAIALNAKAAETLSKMRDIINRNQQYACRDADIPTPDEVM